MTNLFESFKEDEIYNLCFRSEVSTNIISIKSFHLTERNIIKNIFNKNNVGDIHIAADKDNNNAIEEKAYEKAKTTNSRILWFLREIIWSFNNWKGEKLNHYINSVNPDIIFMPAFNCYYPYRVLKHIHTKTKAKIILFHADDNYSLRQYSWSPLYWLYRFGLRYWIKKAVKISNTNYCISQIQVNEYQKDLKTDCKLLYKGNNFKENKPAKNKINSPIKIAFTGNISSGRWKTLGKIADCLKEINKKDIKAILYIYTTNTLTNKMLSMLDIEDSVYLKGAITPDEVKEVQHSVDILLHVESFNLKDKLEVRMSFSTKIVDYLASGNCLLAVGPENVASINYLKENDAAFIITNITNIKTKLESLINNPDLINEYAQKAWDCGRKNHNKQILDEKLHTDLLNILKK